MSKFSSKIALIILTSISFFACSTIKRVPQDRALLVDNTIIENDKKVNKEEIYQQLYQTPNSTFPFTGFHLRLHLYNLAKPNADSLYQVWLKNNPKKEKHLSALLSRKQVDRLGQSFMISGINNFLIKTGEQPVLYDTLKTNKSVARLKNYYFNKGYFDTRVLTVLDTISKQKVTNTYRVETGNPYYIDSVQTNISTKALQELFDQEKNKSLIKSNEVFDVKNFENERKRLTKQFRNKGAYYFQELNIRYEVDTIINKKNKANINLIIDPQTVKSGDTLIEKPFKLYDISEVNIYTDNVSKNKKIDLDSIQHNNFNLYSSTKLQYKPKALTDAVFITKGSKFSDQKRILTSRSISNLRVFNYPVIEYIEDKRDTTGQSLISNIYLTSRKKMTFNPSLDLTHSNIQDFGIGGNIGILFRNVFKGAEILEVGIKGSMGSSRQMNNPNNVFFNVTEYGGDVKLTFPRVFFPINTDRLVPKTMLPTTTMSFGISKQRNIGLDKDNFTGIINYKWLPSQYNSFSFDLANIQYVRNTNPSNYFSVYRSSYSRLNTISQDYKEAANPEYFTPEGNLSISDNGANRFIWDALNPNNPMNVSEADRNTIRSIEERRIRLSENNLIISSNLVFTKTTRTAINDNSFYTLKTKIESAGGLMNALMKRASTKTGPTGKKTILDVEFSQYVKTEIDFIKYWDLGKQRVIAMRAFGGLAIPYGNSSSIPFTRSYYSGGSNDNRGWQSYRLGPGKSGGINDFNEANMKLFFSTEYRFSIGGPWKGALFIDASNIWNVFDEVKDSNYTFNGISSIKDIAVASGFGIRYDFSFFVFRLDMGFKTYNPNINAQRKWFKEFNLKESVLNVGINYPF
ncbi:translocation and assembly module lipoprotein TamL [Myroides pelagicus]|uniref:BamA/TamA family outer membrane protein n=1 Tax=Myroides pelagicus TaxID=270914 RepID=A0A7K1GQ13_9FLAO|nr:BamA/TamA family outer membrane protein [Myroides pelagicus]MEC4115008.1 BamA/TamA family outer membrane protein [Myroides pelagicus]MTH30946.1 BamA/TamA family outer membrane protein [Myroides pelagicus]